MPKNETVHRIVFRDDVSVVDSIIDKILIDAETGIAYYLIDDVELHAIEA